MGVARRNLLQVLSFAFGVNLLSPQRSFLWAAQTARPPAPTPAPATGREAVTGIGGFFFRAHDPDALGRWYLEHLGIALTPTKMDSPVWQQQAGQTVFTPFPETTHYFGDMQKMWMLNFRVHNLDRLVTQLRAAGIDVKADPQSYPNGRFAHLKDPEGNPLELWQPA